MVSSTLALHCCRLFFCIRSRQEWSRMQSKTQMELLSVTNVAALLLCFYFFKLLRQWTHDIILELQLSVCVFLISQSKLKIQNFVSVFVDSSLTCIWSPASTMRVVLLARAKGMMVSHSIAWAASSSRIWENNPAETHGVPTSIHTAVLIYSTFTYGFEFSNTCRKRTSSIPLNCAHSPHSWCIAIQSPSQSLGQ